MITYESYGFTRALEGHLALLMIVCGFTLMWPGDTFALPHYDVLKNIVDEPIGGLILVIVGVFRGAALWINGRKSPTPLPRVLACCVGAAFWFGVFLSIEEAIRIRVIDSPPLMLGVSFTALIMEFYSGLRAGADASYLQSFSRMPRIALWLRQRK